MPALPPWGAVHDPLDLRLQIRSQPSDFRVTEQLSYELDGSGEHEYLWLEKTGANTAWVAVQLASYCGINPRDVGFAGMKDRHAITRQWFSVRHGKEVNWDEFAADGANILECHRHGRKLRRGAHSGNAFRIALRSDDLQQNVVGLEQRLGRIAQHGVPNYFGEQRFGRGGGNIDLCRSLFAGRKLARSKRSIALSTARSLIFNAILDVRVRNGSWNEILPGERANLDGSGSVFSVDALSAELKARCDEMDIHPSGSLWGDGSPMASSDVAALEVQAAQAYTEFAAGLIAARMEPASRALRLRVSGLQWQFEDTVLWLQFDLVKGAFATAVLRELSSHIVTSA